MTPRGRFAPSPTGVLHLGNAATAFLAWLSARSAGGAFVIRLEDLDRPRVVRGSADAMLADLRWLGLDWDEGPDVGGARGPYLQTERVAGYDAAFARLRDAGLVYPCFCSRRDVQAAASAPQEPGDEIRYPGTCRDLAASEVAARLRSGRAAWRFRVERDALEGFDDLVRGRVEPDREGTGDFIVRRADGVTAYQLAVVVDDAAMGMTEVVRGGDLIGSTARQILLHRALASEPPRFGHVPLWLGPDGVRLSKRHRGVTLADRRAGGPGAVLALFARRLGLRARGTASSPLDYVADFSLRGLAAVGPTITLETSD